MKKSLIIAQSLCLSLFSFAADDQPQNAGENLDLNAVLNLFEKSKSVEDFENQLNSEKNDVNNLDLNEDGFVDYIRVIDYADGNTHSLTLQVPYSDQEAQDVAVILIEEEGDESSIQIVGDEDLYGKDVIVEPGDEKNNTVVNVYNWTPVRHIYGPRYVVWVSPWRFGRYPTWYRPWKPRPWSVFHARVRRYHIPCRRVSFYRCGRARTFYHRHRVFSHTYHKNHGHGHAHGKSASNNPGAGNAKVTSPNVNKAKKTTRTNPAPARQGNTVRRPSTNTRSTAPRSNRTQQGNTVNRSAGKPTKRPGGTKKTGTVNRNSGNTVKKTGGAGRGGRR